MNLHVPRSMQREIYEIMREFGVEVLVDKMKNATSSSDTLPTASVVVAPPPPTDEVLKEVRESLKEWADESALLFSYAHLKQVLMDDGMPGTEAQEPIEELAKFFNRNCTTREAQIFANSLTWEKDKAERRNLLNLFSNSSNEARKDLIGQVSRRSAFVEWISDSVQAGFGTWNELLQSITDRDDRAAISGLLNSLNSLESLKFRVAIGRIENPQLRRTRLFEIVRQTDNKARRQAAVDFGYIQPEDGRNLGKLYNLAFDRVEKALNIGEKDQSQQAQETPEEEQASSFIMAFLGGWFNVVFGSATIISLIIGFLGRSSGACIFGATTGLIWIIPYSAGSSIVRFTTQRWFEEFWTDKFNLITAPPAVLTMSNWWMFLICFVYPQYSRYLVFVFVLAIATWVVMVWRYKTREPLFRKFAFATLYVMIFSTAAIFIMDASVPGMLPRYREKFREHQELSRKGQSDTTITTEDALAALAQRMAQRKKGGSSRTRVQSSAAQRLTTPIAPPSANTITVSAGTRIYADNNGKPDVGHAWEPKMSRRVEKLAASPVRIKLRTGKVIHVQQIRITEGPASVRGKLGWAIL